MRLEDFSYNYLKQNFPVSFEKWYLESEGFDGYVEKRIPDINIRAKIKSVAKKLRDKNYNFNNNDLEDIKCFIKNTDNIFHSSQWTANYNTDIKLKSGADLDHIFLFNKIKQSENLAASGLNNIFEIKTYNAHFPHLYSIVKNVQNENNYPVYYPHWQSIYKWLKNENECSYDKLTQFYIDFVVPVDSNKYKAFGSSINVFHIEYLRWCLNTNQGFKKTEESRRLLKKWHYENEQFLNEIHTPMQKMEYINLDKWRLLNETLFKAYIDCFKSLANKQEKEPAKAMVKALTLHGILMKVDEGDYASFYTIARELGIYYQDANDLFILGDIAQKYVAGQISYNDYLKYYILNTEFLINGEVVHPFEEILNTLKGGPLAIDNIVQQCVKCIPIGKRAANATDKLNTFIRRAVDANLIKKEGDKYSTVKDFNLTKKAITKSSLDKVAFENEFVGTGKTKQENIVKEMINRNIPPNILDGSTGNPTHNGGERNDNKYPLNQILFGPPGTGKTYSTITKALNIIGLLEEKNSYTKEEYEAAQELFQNELGKRIEFVTMHQSFSYEDFVQGLKPRKTDDGKGITFDYKNGVFKAICERADESKLLLKRSTTTEETILIDKLFPSFLLSIDEQSVYDTLSAKKFEGKKITQKIAIEYFNEKLGKKYCKAWRDKFDYVLGNKSPRVGYQADKFRDGELEDFKEYSKTFEKLTPEKRKEKLITEWIDDKPETITVENILNNHVIILDEINRANISRVFGELIALIEKDKRDGKLTATLPSGDPFTVPSNLFIIGTMNTADKSIALVDIALRRRFKFIPLYPNSEFLRSVLKENKIEKEEIEKRVNLMTNLNKIIRAKKSVDFEIGHSYFMENETLINILNNQVLPLLNEYFMYDLRKVKEIIEKTQKDKEDNNIPKLGINLNQGIWKDRGLLEVESIDTEAKLVEDALDEADENNSDS